MKILYLGPDTEYLKHRSIYHARFKQINGIDGEVAVLDFEGPDSIYVLPGIYAKIFDEAHYNFSAREIKQVYRAAHRRINAPRKLIGVAFYGFEETSVVFEFVFNVEIDGKTKRTHVRLHSFPGDRRRSTAWKLAEF